MKLNFWPFNCEDRRLAVLIEEGVEEIRLALSKEEGIKAGVGVADEALIPNPIPCETCGGLFVTAKLKSVTHVSIREREGTVLLNEQKHYCGGCHLGIDLEIELFTVKGENLDTVYFSVGEGFLQPFDFQGEEQTFIGVDDYARVTCNYCGLINPKSTAKCPSCRST